MCAARGVHAVVCIHGWRLRMARLLVLSGNYGAVGPLACWVRVGLCLSLSLGGLRPLFAQRFSLLLLLRAGSW